MQLTVLTVNELKGVAAKYMNRALKGTKKGQVVDAFAAACTETGWKLRQFDQHTDANSQKVYYQEQGTQNTFWDFMGMVRSSLKPINRLQCRFGRVGHP